MQTKNIKRAHAYWRLIAYANRLYRLVERASGENRVFRWYQWNKVETIANNYGHKVDWNDPALKEAN